MRLAPLALVRRRLRLVPFDPCLPGRVERASSSDVFDDTSITISMESSAVRLAVPRLDYSPCLTACTRFFPECDGTSQVYLLGHPVGVPELGIAVTVRVLLREG